MSFTARTKRIAMWSGPRNISTALMRAWENRADTAVVDEPFYAFYLNRTGIDHPGREEIIATYETDWRRVVSSVTGPPPNDRLIFYQKHMTHHMLPDIQLDWLAEVINCFLIRDPLEVILSYTRVRSRPTLQDLGLDRQVEIFDFVQRHIDPDPPVIDSRDLLRDPAGFLRRLCDRLGIPFDPAMLSWPAGPRLSDGIWAPYWYKAVERSTGFSPYRPPRSELPPRLQPLLADCQPLYDRLAAGRLR